MKLASNSMRSCMTDLRRALLIPALLLTTLAGCRSIPKGVEAVEPFDLERYLGLWYEIARFDFRFERDLNNVTAFYAAAGEGKISVTNKGYNYRKKQWESVNGKAKFAGERQKAMLLVSFFGPFYSGYNVIAIDPAYRYALVCGESRKYLWILSREKTIPPEIRETYLKKAEQLGFRTADLVWVAHDK